MPPKSPPPDQPELFRSSLANLIHPKHPLVRLAGLIDWERLARTFGPLYRDGIGRPGLPTRLMVGLHLLKYMDGLSDDAVCARYLDSPYVQLFCGETQFQHAPSLDRSIVSPSCCGSGAVIAAATSCTRCTPPRWSASARARRRPDTSLA